MHSLTAWEQWDEKSSATEGRLYSLTSFNINVVIFFLVWKFFNQFNFYFFIFFCSDLNRSMRQRKTKIYFQSKENFDPRLQQHMRSRLEKYSQAAVMVTSLMSSLLGLGTTLTASRWPFMRSLSADDHGLSTLKSMGMSFCWPFSSKFRSNVMWGCTVYPSFLFCPLLGMTLTWVPALLSKRTFTKRVVEEESTEEEERMWLFVCYNTLASKPWRWNSNPAH